MAGIYGLRALQQYWATRAVGPTWGCGYAAGDFRHQYTPTSYADSLVDIVNPVIVHKREYVPMKETEIFLLRAASTHIRPTG